VTTAKVKRWWSDPVLHLVIAAINLWVAVGADARGDTGPTFLFGALSAVFLGIAMWEAYVHFSFKRAVIDKIKETPQDKKDDDDHYSTGLKVGGED
jgi:hypothetical protein